MHRHHVSRLAPREVDGRAPGPGGARPRAHAHTAPRAQLVLRLALEDGRRGPLWRMPSHDAMSNRNRNRDQ